MSAMIFASCSDPKKDAESAADKLTTALKDANDCDKVKAAAQDFIKVIDEANKKDTTILNNEKVKKAGQELVKKSEDLKCDPKDWGLDKLSKKK